MKNEGKYLIFDSTDENIEVLKNTLNFGMGLNGCNKFENSKNFSKVKLETDDNLPLNKALKFSTMAIVIRF